MTPKRNPDKTVSLDTLYKRLGQTFTEIINRECLFSRLQTTDAVV
jgi:hypothetical protein